MPEKLYYQIGTFIQEYDSERPVVIFGTGDYGQFLFEKLHAAGINVAFFTCNSKARYGTTFCNTEVRPPDLVTETDAIIIIAVVDAGSKSGILRQLLDAGVKRTRIVIPIEPIGSLFSDSRLKDIPEFAEVERTITLEYIHRERQYFQDYFVTNELTRLAVMDEDGLVDIIQGLLTGTPAEVRQIQTSSEIGGDDAVIVTDREGFFLLEERLMEELGDTDIPVINFWMVVRPV